MFEYIIYDSRCNKCNISLENIGNTSKCPECLEEIDTLPYEYSFNKYLKLKLNKNEGTTNIYVNNKNFRMCKYIILGIPKNNLKIMKEQEYYENIDQAIKNLEIKNDIYLDKYEEFKGHCSNIATWVENDYDCNILSRSLSIPLIQRLAEIGDRKALHSLKMEIIEKAQSKNKKVLQYIVNENLFRFFSKEELDVLLENIEDKILKLFVEITPIIKTKRRPIEINLFKQSIIIGNNITPLELKYLDTNKLKNKEKYREEIDFKDRNDFKKVNYINWVYYDFHVNNKKGEEHKVKALLRHEHLHLSNRLLGKAKDIKIGIPHNHHQPFKIYSKSKNLIIFITPKKLTKNSFDKWNASFLTTIRKKHRIKRKAREDICYYENLTRKLRYFLRKTDFKIINHSILGKKKIGLRWTLATKEEMKTSLYPEVMNNIDIIYDFIAEHNLTASLYTIWHCDKGKVILNFYISDKEERTMRAFLYPDKEKQKKQIKHYKK
jgi:hypothetical protein